MGRSAGLAVQISVNCPYDKRHGRAVVGFGPIGLQPDRFLLVLEGALDAIRPPPLKKVGSFQVQHVRVCVGGVHFRKPGGQADLHGFSYCRANLILDGEDVA